MKKIAAPFNWRTEPGNKTVDSIENDFALSDNKIVTSDFDHPFKPDVTMAIICIHGTIKGTIDLKPFTAKAPCLFIALSGQIIQYEYISKDFSGSHIMMSDRFLNNLAIDIKESVPLFISVHDNPWIPLNDEELESIVEFYTMMQKTVRASENPHRMEIVKHLTQAFFYSSGYNYYKLPAIEERSKKDILAENFLALVKSNFKERRGMEFYADKLCLTPKYLSKVIKENTGKSANEWIDNYVILEARALFRSTNMTVQQVSDELNFPNQSFFGKYFKRHTGESPKAYRKS